MPLFLNQFFYIYFDYGSRSTSTSKALKNVSFAADKVGVDMYK